MQDSVIESNFSYQVPKMEKIKNVFNRIIKFIGNLIFTIIFVLVIVIVVYSLYTKKNGTNGHTPIVSAYVIISPSMVPTINVEDAVIAYKPNTNNLKKGDIITFSSTDARYTGLTVTHRILKVNKDAAGSISYKTKGDNNTTPDDSEVLGSNIYGKVIFVVPWLGYLQYFLTKSYGWILLIVLPCIGIIIYDVTKLLRTVKNSKITKDVKFKDVEILDFDDDSSSDTSNDNVEELSNEDSVEELNSEELGEEKSNDSSDDDIELL